MSALQRIATQVIDPSESCSVVLISAIRTGALSADWLLPAPFSLCNRQTGVAIRGVVNNY